MTPAARLQATLDLMGEALRAARPADASVSAFVRARRQIGDADRGRIIDLFYVLLRHEARLGWWLARLGQADTPRQRLLAWLVLGERRTSDRIAGLFDGGKDSPAVLVREERALLRALEGQRLEPEDMPRAVRLECPDWALGPLEQRFGAGLERELVAMLTPAPLDLRVNPFKGSRAAMLGDLGQLGIAAQPTPYSPLGIRIGQKLSLARLPMLKTGALEIQDEGSQLVALLLEARPGDRVVDFCAGAGGKTLAIAAQMENKGHVVACDVMEGRLLRAAERFRQAGLHNIQTRVLASETDRWVKRHKLGFDRVLVDAPCSGTGTWRRNPDARWRPQEAEGLADLLALQGRILASAARLVRPGGRLVYATCSLLRPENEDQVTAFLAAHPAFRLVPLPPVAAPVAGDGPYLSLTPAQHDTDGFFAAVLEREAEPAA